MKMVLIAYNEAIDDEVMEILEANSVKGYTKWTKVLGQGKTSGPHLLTHVWPKANNVVAAAVDDTTGAQLMEKVLHLRRALGKEGIKAFSLPVDAVT